MRQRLAIVVDKLPTDFEIVVYTGDNVLEGERVSLSKALGRGKPALVEFWAGLCPVCRGALPDVQAAYEVFSDAITFIGVDIGAYANLGSEADARALYAELGLSFPAGFLPESAVLQAYRVTGIPTMLLFKPNGEVFYRASELVSRDTLYQALESLIAASKLQEELE